ncbi:MAG: UTRA domain-containing protein [Pseudomonadota bacterium]
MSQPRYLLIKNALLEKIHSGSYQPDDRIPSEHKLAEQFSVSRLTVQRAIRELVSEGLLRRAQGSGTFVNNFTHRFSLLEVRDVVEEIALLGGKPSTEVLMHRRVTPPQEIDDLLELNAGAEVFHVSLLQSMDDEPVAHEERFAVIDTYPDFLDQDFSKRSVFEYLAARSTLEEIENIVSAVHVGKRLAQMLEIDPGEPCVRVQRRNWFKGKCVTVTRITYAGARQVLASRYRPYSNDSSPN